MKFHRYPMRSLIWDYVRALAGLMIALVPLLVGTPGTLFLILLTLLALLFAGYGLRTLRLQLTAYELMPDGIASHGPLRRFYAWDALSKIHLRYYSTAREKNKRDLKRGWLELKLVSPTGTLRIDSTVEGFPVILDAVSAAADDREMDETTRENFKAFRADDADLPPPPPAQTPPQGSLM